MTKTASFSAVVRMMLDRWYATSPERPAPADLIYQNVLPMLSIKMRLTLFRIDGDHPLQWRMTPVRHSGFTSSLININKTFEEQRLGDFKDQTYIAEAVLPRLRQVVENQQPSMELVKTRLFGIKLGYDRILIPQRATGRPAWVISSSNARFLLDAPKVHSAFDVDDEAVVQLLLEGCTAKEIAAQLDLSPRTVEHRLERLKTRFGARNLVHLVVMLLGGHVNRDGQDSVS